MTVQEFCWRTERHNCTASPEMPVSSLGMTNRSGYDVITHARVPGNVTVKPLNNVTHRIRAAAVGLLSIRGKSPKMASNCRLSSRCIRDDFSYVVVVVSSLFAFRNAQYRKSRPTCLNKEDKDTTLALDSYPVHRASKTTLHSFLLSAPLTHLSLISTTSLICSAI